MGCWGSPANDFASVLPDTRFEDLSLGTSYFCGLDAGEIECFLEHDETDDPAGVLQAPAGGFAKIATASTHACGIRTGGELACWGEDSAGKASPPAGAFTDLDLAFSYGCATGADGALACWGLLPSD